MRSSGYTRKTPRKSQMAATPSAGTAAATPRRRASGSPRSVVAKCERGGGRESDGDRRAHREGLVMPGVAHVHLEAHPCLRFHVVAQRVAQVGGEHHARVEAVLVAGVERHVLGPYHEHAAVARL